MINYETLERETWTLLIASLQKHQSENKHGYWTDGNEILCKTEAAAEHLADFFEDIGFTDVQTGYYDPEEDLRDLTVDEHTGFYYVSID